MNVVQLKKLPHSKQESKLIPMHAYAHMVIREAILEQSKIAENFKPAVAELDATLFANRELLRTDYLRFLEAEKHAKKHEVGDDQAPIKKSVEITTYLGVLVFECLMAMLAMQAITS